MLLGAVGAYDWNGTVVLHKDDRTITPKKNDFFNPKIEAGYEGLAGYLGELKFYVFKMMGSLHSCDVYNTNVHIDNCFIVICNTVTSIPLSV